MKFQSIRRVMALTAGAAALVVMTGCAHQISMSPESAKQGPVATAPAKINKSVAYVISAADMAKEVQTPGGGGDKIKYTPYKDLDASLYQAFSAVFTDVTKVSSAAEAKDVTFVITPTITTNSSSSSMFTWPPTQFSVDLVCKAADMNGKVLAEITANGTGAAEFSEFKSDFSLAARRASKDAVDKLVKALAESPALR
jgi:hypothetical protein